VRIGLHPTRFNWADGDAGIRSHVAATIRRTEDAGFAGYWPMDHFFQIPMGGRPAKEPMLEGYGLLAFAAGITERMQLGLLVTGVTYRHPGILVKTVTTLDVLCGGRAWLGIGAAWNEREHTGLGVPFPPLAERFERLDETLQIALQMWSGEVSTYNGKHYQLAETLNQPMPLRKPHPPIMIGGGGERKTLRLVAQYADACNLFVTPELPHKLDVLRVHCAEVGRPYEAIEKTVTMRFADDRPTNLPVDPVEALERLAQLADLGIDQAIVVPPEPLELETLDLFGERIIPEASKLEVRGREEPSPPL
jgi:F420-dependent oxidoreductase-like protein